MSAWIGAVVFEKNAAAVEVFISEYKGGRTMKRKLFFIVLLPLLLSLFALTGDIYGQKKTTTTKIKTAITPVSAQLKTLMIKRKALTALKLGGVTYLGPETGRSYYLINKKTGNSIDLYGCYQEWAGGSIQRFIFLRADSGYHYFLSINSRGYVLFTADDGQVGHVNFSGKEQQKFIFEDAGESFYYIKNKQNGKYLYDSNADSARHRAATAPKQATDDFKFMLVSVD